MLNDEDRAEVRKATLKWLIGGVLAGAAAAIAAGWAYLNSIDKAALAGAVPANNIVVMSLVECKKLGDGWERFEEANGQFVVAARDLKFDHPETGHPISAKAFGSFGGEEEVMLTDPEQMPPHRHPLPFAAIDGTSDFKFTDAGNGANIPSLDYTERRDIEWETEFTNTNSGVGSVGGSQTHNNMPPYIALYFCKKT